MDSPAVSSYFPPDSWLTGMNLARTRQLVTGEVLVAQGPQVAAEL